MSEPLKTVFISYSWDSEEHKAWVIKLATGLRASGIEVILDAWDVDLGDDLTAFMERSVKEADRVLIICTDSYVIKAEGGIGGVGYEKMIVTGELVRDLGTKKFIPVIREGTLPNNLVPNFLATRLYCDFRRDEEFNTALEMLVNSIISGGKVIKPPLGTITKIAEPADVEVTLAPTQELALKDEAVNPASPNDVYLLARDLIAAHNIVDWRKLAQKLKNTFKPALRELRQNEEGILPNSDVPLNDVTDKAVDIIAPSIAMALAGVESTEDKFNDQRALFDELYHITDWRLGGRVIIIELPATLGFVYQALHGAVCIYTEQPQLAIEFAIMPVRHNSTEKHSALWKRHDLIGWPKTLGGNCSLAWNYLIDSYTKWEWLHNIFGDAETFKTSLIGYYILLNFMEYIESLQNGSLANSIKNDTRLLLDVPLIFAEQERGVVDKALKQLARQPAIFDSIIKKMGASKNQVITDWDSWIKVCDQWNSKSMFYSSSPGEKIADLLIYLGWKKASK